MILKIKRCFKNYLLGVMSLGVCGSAQGHYQAARSKTNSLQSFNGSQRLGVTSDDFHERAPQLIKFINLIKEISFLLGVQFTKESKSFLNSVTYKNDLDGGINSDFVLTESSPKPSPSLFKNSEYFLYALSQRLHHIIYIDSVISEYEKYLDIKYWDFYKLLTKIESPPPEKRNPSQADLKLHEIFMLFYDLSARLQNPEEPLTYREVISQFIEKEQHLIESFNQEFFLNLFK